MIDHEMVVERCVVLNMRRPGKNEKAQHDLDEAAGLAAALGVEIVHQATIPLREVHVANYLGGGKIVEIADVISAEKASIVVMNCQLSPIQQRNLERIWKVKVVDRTGLILEIFGLRAATKEGRLQVELARLAYERSRLVRTWTHLERQRGGQGFLAGPGETQIESDRRVLSEKMTKLRRALDQVRRTRGLQRSQRQKAPERVVALVGYTNAGKSTLFNLLTDGGVLAKDMLFATLDTTHRILQLPNGKPAVLSDTVGFIADLPTDLITAFRATLEEVKESDILLHVRDISDPISDERRDNVLEILDQIEAGPDHGQMIIEVWNKVDRLSGENKEATEQRAEALRESDQDTDAHVISCATGEGVEALREAIERALTAKDDVIAVAIPPKDFKVRAWLHEHGLVIAEDVGEGGVCNMQVQLSDVDIGKFRAKHPQLIVTI